MKILAVVAARGGSKGLPGKNIADCAGKPLISWTIEAAKRKGTSSDATWVGDEFETRDVDGDDFLSRKEFEASN